MPRDRSGSFAPAIVPKHSRRVQGFDAAILALYAKGLTTGEIQAHLSEIYDVEVSRDVISRATHQVGSELEAWRNRPRDRVYAVVMIDAIVVKVRDGAVANRPVYVAVGINLEGERDVLGMWVGKGGEGAKTWLTELRNRGVEDVLIACCDGLKGLPESIQNTWPQADVQLCVVHMVRASLKYASTKYWAQIARELRHVYTAANADAAEDRFAEFEAEWGARYPALIGVWRRNWEHFVMFLRFPPEIRKIVYTTNVIESLNARFRQATRRRGHFPDEDSALKVLYLVIRDRQPNRPNVTGRTRNWKGASTPSPAFMATGSSRISSNSTRHRRSVNTRAYTKNKTLPGPGGQGGARHHPAHRPPPRYGLGTPPDRGRQAALRLRRGRPPGGQAGSDQPGRSRDRRVRLPRRRADRHASHPAPGPARPRRPWGPLSLGDRLPGERDSSPLISLRSSPLMPGLG